MRTQRALIYGDAWQAAKKIENVNDRHAAVYALAEYAFEGSVKNEESYPLVVQVLLQAQKPSIDKGIQRYTARVNNGVGGGRATAAMEQIKTAWDVMAEEEELAKAGPLKKPLQQLMAEVLENHDVNEIIGVINRVEIMPYLCGENDREWKMDFPWFLNNFEKIASNNYVDGKKRKEWVREHMDELEEDEFGSDFSDELD